MAQFQIDMERHVTFRHNYLNYVRPPKKKKKSNGLKLSGDKNLPQNL